MKIKNLTYYDPSPDGWRDAVVTLEDGTQVIASIFPDIDPEEFKNGVILKELPSGLFLFPVRGKGTTIVPKVVFYKPRTSEKKK